MSFQTSQALRKQWISSNKKAFFKSKTFFSIQIKTDCFGRWKINDCKLCPRNFLIENLLDLFNHILLEMCLFLQNFRHIFQETFAGWFDLVIAIVHTNSDAPWLDKYSYLFSVIFYFEERLSFYMETLFLIK